MSAIFFVYGGIGEDNRQTQLFLRLLCHRCIAAFGVKIAGTVILSLQLYAKLGIINIIRILNYRYLERFFGKYAEEEMVMLIVTTDTIPGMEIVEVKGLCKGSTVRSKNVGSDIGSSLKGLVGGELNSYSDMLTEARQIAIGRMVEDAEAQGANAVVAMRLGSAAVMSGAAEIVAYGTAVVVK